MPVKVFYMYTPQYQYIFFLFQYSEPLKKLFIDMNKYVLAQFNVGQNPPNDLAIRITPIYAVAGFFTSPVRRCPNHASPQDPSNEELREVIIFTKNGM